MNENLYEALEVCLQAVETGADVESVMKRYPQIADELRPALEASASARALASFSVPETAVRRGRARVLQHAAAMRESSQGIRRPLFSLRHLAVSLALALVFLLSGTGLVRASKEALPGDRFYPVKRTWEDMRLFMVFDSDIREGLENEFEQERLEEINELLAEERSEMVAFAGLVSEQNGNQWRVAGIFVQITPESILPIEPVMVGAFVNVEGHTTAQGFVEAERIEMLQPGASLPSVVPTRIVPTPAESQDEGVIVDENSNNSPEETQDISDDGNDNGGDAVERNDDSSIPNENGNDSESNHNDDDSGHSDNGDSDDSNEED
ncbi:MAG: DUF5667 domain-containing protein [Chloroflexota bacterium]